MYEVSVEEHFDAAHYLRGYGGRCEKLHGHRFEVQVTVQAQGVDEIGLAYDFGELRKKLREVLERFDHTCLNETPPFDRINPSSENIAATIYNEFQGNMGEIPILRVRVCESPQACVTYSP